MRIKTISQAFVSVLLFCGCSRKTVGGLDTVIVRHTVVQQVIMDDPGPPPDDLKPVHATVAAWITSLCAQEHPSDSIVAYDFTLVGSGDHYIGCMTGARKHPENERRIDFEPKEMWCLLPDQEYKGLSFLQANEKFVAAIKLFVGTSVFRQSFFARAQRISINYGPENLAAN